MLVQLYAKQICGYDTTTSTVTDLQHNYLHMVGLYN